MSDQPKVDSASRKAFLEDKDSTKFWVGIARSQDFRRVVMYARSIFMESHPEKLHTEGAERILNILFTMSDNDESWAPWPGPGLHHQIDRDPNDRPVKEKE